MCALQNAGNMTLAPDSKGLYLARAKVRDLLRRLSLDQDDRDHLLIAVGEAISNAYLHGTADPQSGRIVVTWIWADDRVTFTISDSGSRFRAGLPFRPSGHRGALARGVELMLAGTDELGFSYNGGARVELVKRLHGKSAA